MLWVQGCLLVALFSRLMVELVRGYILVIIVIITIITIIMMLYLGDNLSSDCLNPKSAHLMLSQYDFQNLQVPSIDLIFNSFLPSLALNSPLSHSLILAPKGEAAMYACGCWAQGGRRPTTTLSSSCKGKEGEAVMMTLATASTNDLGSSSATGGVGASLVYDFEASYQPSASSGFCSAPPGLCSASYQGSDPRTSPPGVAVSVSGVGEAVIRSLLAREAAVQLRLRPEVPVDQVRGGKHPHTQKEEWPQLTTTQREFH